MRGTGVLAVLAFGIAGCATIDTGEIDYRRAEPPRPGNYTDYASKACADLTVAQLRNPQLSRQCPPLLPAPLYRKYAGVGDAIAPNSIYSIRLEQGLIAYMSEPKFSLRRLGRAKNPFRKRGEIAVLAQTFEFAATADQARATKARFVDPTSLNDVRVIYYSPDVEEEQTLNFSNIPLQSPTRYSGNPVGIQIVVVELDRTSTPIKALLKQLAALGSSTGVIPGDPVSKVLLDLGTSLLTQPNDDIVFDYRFVLDPSEGALGSTSAPFEAGRYLLRRVDDRNNEAIWRNLRLDHNTGRLLQLLIAEDKTERWVEFSDDTWFTVNVIKHNSATPSFYDFGTFGELSSAIDTAADTRDAPFGEAAASIVEIAKAERSKRWTSDVAKAAQAAVSNYRVFGAQLIAATAPAAPSIAQCKVDPEALARADIAAINARDSALRFVELYAKAMNDVEGKETIFATADQRAALIPFAAYFAPFAPEGKVTAGVLSDPVKFRTAFVDDPGALLTEMEAVAATRLAAQNCDELVTRGLASTVEDGSDTGSAPRLVVAADAIN